MPRKRAIRWAQVEYQPNLQTPVKPIPLGVIGEEVAGKARTLVIFGREPNGPMAMEGLCLEDTWGPFEEAVTQWMEAFSKSLNEFGPELRPNDYFLDELVRRWNLNVYVREPEIKTFQSKISLDAYLRRWYEEYVGVAFPTPRKRMRKSQLPWIAKTNSVLQAVG